MAKFILSAAVRESGYNVVLTGERSDEVLAGYPTFRRDMLLNHTQGQDPAEVARLIAELEKNNQAARGVLMPEGETDTRTVCKNVLGFVPTWLEAQSAAALRMHAIMRDDVLEARRSSDFIGTLLASLDIEHRIKGRNAAHGALYLWAKTALPHYILSNLGDRMEMALGGRTCAIYGPSCGRVSASDAGVDEIRGMTERYILREATKNVITDTVYKRQKHPFLSPPSTMHRDGPYYSLIQDTLRSRAAANVPLLDQAKLVRMLDGLNQDTMDLGKQLVADQLLMGAFSYVFMHERLGVAS